jgi:cephalosporin-C deacetylase-like acetyl esterase
VDTRGQGGGYLPGDTRRLRACAPRFPDGAVLADVPFLSDFRRAAQVATVAPYLELTH